MPTLSPEFNPGSGLATAEQKFTTSKTEAACSYGTFILFYQTEGRNIPEKLNINLLEKRGYKKC